MRRCWSGRRELDISILMCRPHRLTTCWYCCKLQRVIALQTCWHCTRPYLPVSTCTLLGTHDTVSPGFYQRQRTLLLYTCIVWKHGNLYKKTLCNTFDKFSQGLHKLRLETLSLVVSKLHSATWHPWEHRCASYTSIICACGCHITILILHIITYYNVKYLWVG